MAAQIGLPSYEVWPQVKIEDHVVARGLCRPAGLKYMVRAVLILMLEEADRLARLAAIRRPCYNVFATLPDELQLRICELATLEDEDLNKPLPPPICYVSRRLRADSLPAFFGQNAIHVNVDTSKKYKKRKRECSAPPPARLNKGLLEYLTLADERAWLGYIRRFGIAVHCLNGPRPRELERFCVTFRRGLQDVAMAVEIDGKEEVDGQSAVEEGLRVVADGIVAQANVVQGEKLMKKEWVLELLRSIHTIE